MSNLAAKVPPVPLHNCCGEGSLAALHNDGVVDASLDRGENLWHTKIIDTSAAASWQDQGFRELYAKIATGSGNSVPRIYEYLPHFLKDETNLRADETLV